MSLETRLEKAIEAVKMAPVVELKPLIGEGDMPPFNRKFWMVFALDQVISEEDYQSQIKEGQKKSACSNLSFIGAAFL